MIIVEMLVVMITEPILLKNAKILLAIFFLFLGVITPPELKFTD